MLHGTKVCYIKIESLNIKEKFVMRNKKRTEEKLSPKVSDVLGLLGTGVLLSSLFVFPAAGLGIGAIYNFYQELKKERDLKEWEKFNLPRLRYILKRLERQKMVETAYEGEYTSIKITRKGKAKLLKYKLGSMQISKPKSWDGKWRLILYDIKKFKKREQRDLRLMLRQLEFLPLQKSVYLTPYSCKGEIEFLREHFNVGEGVLYAVVETIENEDVYKKYFGL